MSRQAGELSHRQGEALALPWGWVAAPGALSWQAWEVCCSKAEAREGAGLTDSFDFPAPNESPLLAALQLWESELLWPGLASLRLVGSLLVDLCARLLRGGPAVVLICQQRGL